MALATGIAVASCACSKSRRRRATSSARASSGPSHSATRRRRVWGHSWLDSVRCSACERWIRAGDPGLLVDAEHAAESQGAGWGSPRQRPTDGSAIEPSGPGHESLESCSGCPAIQPLSQARVATVSAPAVSSGGLSRAGGESIPAVDLGASGRQATLEPVRIVTRECAAQEWQSVGGPAAGESEKASPTP